MNLRIWVAIVVVLTGLVGLATPLGVQDARAQTAGYSGPFEDGCYYYWNTPTSRYTERQCPRADEAFDVFVPDGNGNWAYWGTGLWLDNGTFVKYTNSGYYGIANGCSYFWDGNRVLEAACQKENGWYGVALYDSAQGTWSYFGEAQWFEDGSKQVVFHDGTVAVASIDGSVAFFYTDGMRILVHSDGSIYADNAQGNYGMWDSYGVLIEQGTFQTATTAQAVPEMPAVDTSSQSTSMQLYEYASEHPDDPNALGLFQMYSSWQSSMAETWTAPDCNWSLNGCW